MTKANNNTLAQDAALLESIVDSSATMDLHRSNLMRMQIKELLEECQLDIKTRKWTTEAHEYLQTLTKVISQINGKSIGETAIKDRADKVVHIEPLPSANKQPLFEVEPIGCTKSQFGWTKKSGNANVLPTFTLMLLLPQELFLPKDYLNHRYFDKRNYVMNKIALHLAKHSKKLGTVQYKWYKGTNRSPYLELVPTTQQKHKSSKFIVHLHFGMRSMDWIPQIRLVPNRCNIKQAKLDDEQSTSFGAAKSVQSQLYNQSLLYDARHQFEDPYLSTLADYPTVEPTLVLIQVWALKRGLWRNHDGWSKENVAIFLLYLLRTNRMNPRMTPIQQFTVALQMWATTNWLGTGSASSSSHLEDETKNQVRASQSQASQFVNDGASKRRLRRDVLVLPLEEETEKETIRQSELARLYERQTKDSPLTDNDPPTLMEAYASVEHYNLGPVMMDPTLTYNYLGDVSPNYMKLLQYHAAKSLQGLKATRSAFEHMFLENVRFWNQWDIYIQIPVRKTSEEWELSTRRLVQKLELALGNRIYGMRVLSTGNGDVSLQMSDLDQFPSEAVDKNSTGKQPLNSSPTGTRKIVLGISVNPETSQRVVDRGPPSDHREEVKSFVDLWGEKAQLRRFKDGAIVQAVVWNDDDGKEQYQNQVRLQGGYIEKIVRHIVRVHYTKEQIDVALPHLLSVVDGITSNERAPKLLVDPFSAHQQIMKAYESLASFLRENSRPLQQGRQQSSLGLPLAIDGVEPLSPCLRYSELFPPIPHPFLGGNASTSKKVSGALMAEPVLIQIRFGASSKWPSDLKAIGAAKTAMLIQLANGIDAAQDSDFDGPIIVTPNYVDLGYRGYCFRILVRADAEIRMLQGLVRPSAVASSLLKDLTRVHVVAPQHHSMMHAVHTLHPSSGAVVRMAKRWIANHLLSGLISVEAIELIVAKVYSDGETRREAPSTVVSGFLRFLHFLSSHDWLGEPLIVNPRGHIDESEIDEIHQQFEKMREENRDAGPPMFIIAPYDRQDAEENDSTNRNAVNVSNQSVWLPTTTSPEWVVVTRAVALAKRSYTFMMQKLLKFDDSSDWSAIFHESSSSFHSYSVLLRVGTDFIVDPEASSTSADLSPHVNEDGILESSYTRSMKARVQGPKGLRRKVYRNLQHTANDAGDDTILLCWQPVENVMSSLRRKFGDHALFFYNELAPEVIGLVWRPDTFKAMSFSAMTAEYARPKDDADWKNDSLVVRNATDLLREMSEYYQEIITTAKIIDETCLVTSPKKKKRKLSD